MTNQPPLKQAVVKESLTTPNVNTESSNGNQKVNTPTNSEAVDWENSLNSLLWENIDSPQQAHSVPMKSELFNDLKQFIRQTHLDLLREVEKLVIEKDDPSIVDGKVPDLNTYRNVLRAEQRTKLSHIIKRVERKAA